VGRDVWLAVGVIERGSTVAKVKVNTEAVKRNGAAIGCGVVVLAAVVASFYPLGGLKEKLTADVQKSAGAQATLEGALSKPHPLPVLTSDPTAAAAEAKNLEGFPTEDVIAAVGRVVEQAKAQSTAMLDAAIQINQHKLLVPGSLPTPTPTAKLMFRDAYEVEFNQTIPAIMNAGTPPPDQDIQRAMEAKRLEIEQTRLIKVNGQPVNMPEVQSLQQQVAIDLPKQMRGDVAKTHKVYIGSAVQQQGGPNPALDALTVMQNVMNPAAQPDDPTMWFAQVGAWVQEDVARAVAECNAKATSVLDAPVKHVLKIQVPAQYVKDTPAGTASSEDPGAAITPVKTISMTGRTCNPMYDVIHFTLTMRVQADELPVVLTTFCHNRLFTPLEVNVSAYDDAAALANGYMYGDKPVVEVAMKVEALQLRRWTVRYMPPLIKTFLGIPATAATPGAAGAAAAAG
jgi:hypothetical protein